MKKFISTNILACIGTSLIIHHAACQSILNSVASNVRTVNTNTPGYNTALPANTAKEYRNSININAVRNFIKDFKDVKNVTWHKTKDDIYVARFISDSIRTMVVYNKKGSWNYTLKKYAENKMPTEMRTMVKSIYFDYTIMEVSETRQRSDIKNIIYNVLITYRDNFKVLQICNGEMAITADFTKP